MTARTALLAVALLAAPLGGCGDDKKTTLPPPPSGKRSEVVKATAAATTTAPTVTAAPKPTGPRPPLCASPPLAAGRSLPGGTLPHFEAPGTPALADKIPTGGRWTWVNLWAAWCGPCKEEIPRLKAWETRLAQAGTPINLVFLSLDDDERQARKFLAEQPPTGLRASWWLQEGKSRAAWLEGVRMKADPQLPVHILADAQGAVRCVIEGAVEDSDFAQIQAVVARRLAATRRGAWVQPGRKIPSVPPSHRGPLEALALVVRSLKPCFAMRAATLGLVAWMVGVAVVACSASSVDTTGSNNGAAGAGSEQGQGGSAGEGEAGGASGMGGGVNIGGQTGGSSQVCQAKEAPGKRVPANVLVVLDRSGSMNDGGKWPAATGAINTMVTSADQELRMGLLRYPEGSPSSCTNPFDIACANEHECTDIKDIPNVPVGPLKNTSAQIQNIIATTSPNGGTPTLGALRKAYKYMQELQTDGERFVLLVTDGVPNFYTPPMPPLPELNKSCGTKAELGQATTDARKGNPTVRTFVIGAPGSEDGLEILSGLALNGGTCRPGGSHGNYTCHYQIGAANFEKELAKVLTDIAGSVSNCTYAVPAPSSGEVDPDLVNVTVKTAEGEQLVYKDEAQQDGWNYTDNSKTKIQIFGPQCEAINKGTEATVTIGLGCQTQVKLETALRCISLAAGAGPCNARLRWLSAGSGLG